MIKYNKIYTNDVKPHCSVIIVYFKLFIEKNNGLQKNKNMKQTVKLNESQLRKIVAESVKKVLKETRILKEHEDDWFDESDTAYIGRTSAYYEDDDSSVYTPDYWTYSTEPNDREFAGEVYELNNDGKQELNYWLRCQRFNEYQRAHAFAPRNESPEQEWNLLTKQYGRRIR